MGIEDSMDTYDSTGPIGSTDCQIPIDVNELHNALNDENSSVKELWAEYQIGERTKKLGRYCEDVTLSIFLVGSYLSEYDYNQSSHCNLGLVTTYYQSVSIPVCPLTGLPNKTHYRSTLRNCCRQPDCRAKSARPVN